MVEIESQPHCANCGRQVHEDWIICPTCRNRLRRVCPNCRRLVELDWSLCAWCGKDFERPDAAPGSARRRRPRAGRPGRPSQPTTTICPPSRQTGAADLVELDRHPRDRGYAATRRPATTDPGAPIDPNAGHRNASPHFTDSAAEPIRLGRRHTRPGASRRFPTAPDRSGNRRRRRLQLDLHPPGPACRRPVRRWAGCCRSSGSSCSSSPLQAGPPVRRRPAHGARCCSAGRAVERGRLPDRRARDCARRAYFRGAVAAAALRHPARAGQHRQRAAARRLGVAGGRGAGIPVIALSCCSPATSSSSGSSASGPARSTVAGLGLPADWLPAGCSSTSALARR